MRLETPPTLAAPGPGDPAVPPGAPPGRRNREGNGRARLLHELTLELVGTLDQREVAARLVDGALVAADGATVSLWVTEDNTLACRLARGPESESLVGVTMPLAGAQSDGETDPSAIMAPMVAGGATVGALRISRPADGAAPFTAADRVFLHELAASGAVAFRNCARFRAADRTRDFALVMEMSREVTATLDLDRVLRSVVNLAMRMISFDRGAVALYERGECDIRSVAGTTEVNRDDPALRDLAARSAWAAGVGESFYLSDRSEPASDAERIFLQIFGDDLAANDVGSGLYLPLKDEEGVVGILVFEAARVDFADERQRELATVLANQTTVAIRNAQLYSQVPLADALGAISAKRRAFLEIPARRRMTYAAIAIAALAAVTLVRWPLRVAGTHPIFRPTARAEVRPLVPGIIERVLVREGALVRRGDPVVLLRDVEVRAEHDAAVDAANAADRAAEMGASRRDAAEEQLQRGRAASLRRAAAVLDEQLQSTVVRSPVTGAVLTPHPEERLGTSVEAGDAVVLVGRTDTLELEFAVDQRDIDRVRVGDEVRVRVDALPQHTFQGRVLSIASVPDDTAGIVAFPVRALVPNPDGLLRPGMQGYARTLTAPASVAGRTLRGPARQARLLWWRLWS